MSDGYAMTMAVRAPVERVWQALRDPSLGRWVTETDLPTSWQSWRPYGRKIESGVAAAPYG